MQKKFKLKDDLSISIHIQPPHSIVDDVFHSREAPYDRIISFAFSIDAMVTYLQKVVIDNSLMEQGYLFFVYPKKGNKNMNNFFIEMKFPQQSMWMRKGMLMVVI